MKVLIDAVGIKTGGTATVLNNVLWGLIANDSNIDIVVYLDKNTLDYNNLYKHRNIQFEPIKELTLFEKVLWQQINVQKKARLHNVDLLLSLTNVVSYFPRVSSVVYFHQALFFLNSRRLYDIFGFDYFIRFLFIRFFISLGFKSSQAIICQTETAKKQIIEKGYANKKIHVIPSGIPKDFGLDKVTNKNFNFDFDGLSILFVSHPAEYKNYSILFETARLSKAEKIRFKFILTLDVNKGDERYKNFVNSYLKKIKEYKIEDYFLFMGRLDSAEEVNAAIKAADVIIHPSLIESFPQTFTESMVAGKALVSADLGYARDICKESSLYFKPDSPKQLLKQIKSLNREELNRMSRLSLKRSSHFEPVSCWGALLTVLRKVKNESQ
ncbi:hypothetical protein BCT73_06575 [Vibrio breoganii]|uniref:glycosyltransferase n=1 Tax=Vibrio breoganii TaxID=553239 RepID=UPI000CB60547|nr:glycosyltransferase [Vibrio breoganii]PML61250.1 hypothetical protein BCT73_06575 [Vibrio breoganii]